MLADKGSQRQCFRRYLATNSVSTTFAITTAGPHLLGADPAATMPIFPIGKSLAATFVFFGSGSAAQTFDFRIWGVCRMMTNARVVDPGSLIYPLGGGTATLSTLTGATGNIAITPTTDLVAGTLTWTASTTATTPKGPQATIETAYNEGLSSVFSPTGNVGAMLFIPTLGRATGLIVDFDMTGATSGNCLIQVDEF